ncbi:MAG: hypothetical protein QW701_03210 [Candidatus Nezhaarchaeales archaeon]
MNGCELISRIHKVLSVMYFLSAINDETAVGISEIAKYSKMMNENEVNELLKCCKELGYVNEEGGRFYLTYRGIISALSISS